MYKTTNKTLERNLLYNNKKIHKLDKLRQAEKSNKKVDNIKNILKYLVEFRRKKPIYEQNINP